jgi:outer membrane lipoprotein SlyB
MPRFAPIAALCATFALGACAVAPPTGPSVMALPAKDKDFAAFQQDDATCRQYASGQIGNASPAQAANESLVNSAAAGTVLGAAAGAALGAATGNPAAGAAIGAASGLVLGTATGAGAADYSSASLQRRYDVGYTQCMYSKGDTVAAAPGAPGPYGYYPYGPYAYAGYPYYPYYYPSVFIGGGFGFHRHFR